MNSIANVVFLAGAERYAVPHSSFLFHGVGFNIPQPTRFDEKQVRERLMSIQKDQETISEIIAARTKLTKAEVGKMFLEAQTKTPSEAKTSGIIHAIKEAKIPDGAKIISFVFG